MEKKDAYKLVTDRIIEALEAGIVPWHKPWRAFGGDAPQSLATGKPYQGVNVWTLAATAMLRGYSSPYWTTFKQAKERGGSVRKGEKGTAVIFWKFIEKTDAAGDVTDRIPLLRYFTVFNLDQCDGIEAPATETMPERDPIEACEAIAAGYRGGPEVKHGGDRAYYSPGLDYVGMPQLGAFDTSEHYYGTLFHELIHSTGHADRLGRKSLIHPAPFGSEDYSREELIAEMGAAFLCGQAGIEVNVQHHASYIGSWLRNLENDPKLVVQAGAAASKAASLILGDPAEVTEEGSVDTEPSSGSVNHAAPRWTAREARNGNAPLRYAKPSARDSSRALGLTRDRRTCGATIPSRSNPLGGNEMPRRRTTVDATTIVTTANAMIAHLAEYGTKAEADKREAIISVTSAILLAGNAYRGFGYLEPPTRAGVYDDTRIHFYA